MKLNESLMSPPVWDEDARKTSVAREPRSIPIHGWEGIFHGRGPHPWIYTLTRGPYDPSHGENSIRGLADSTYVGDHPCMKVLVPIAKVKFQELSEVFGRHVTYRFIFSFALKVSWHQIMIGNDFIARALIHHGLSSRQMP